VEQRLGGQVRPKSITGHRAQSKRKQRRNHRPNQSVRAAGQEYGRSRKDAIAGGEEELSVRNGLPSGPMVSEQEHSKQSYRQYYAYNEDRD
jgi:hypothetical protein